MVYLIHFSKPFHHAKHYMGFCRPGRLEERFIQHRKGDGANIIAHVVKAKIELILVRIWTKGDRSYERRLKRRKNSPKLCPICNAKLEGEKV